MPSVDLDRRTDSRIDSFVGLLRWLEKSRQELGVEALALADACGCVIAGAGPARRCEELAAFAPLFGGPWANMTCCRPVLDRCAWLCTVPNLAQEVPWDHIELGCARILGTVS